MPMQGSLMMSRLKAFGENVSRAGLNRTSACSQRGRDSPMGVHRRRVIASMGSGARRYAVCSVCPSFRVEEHSWPLRKPAVKSPFQFDRLFNMCLRPHGLAGAMLQRGRGLRSCGTQSAPMPECELLRRALKLGVKINCISHEPARLV